MIKIIKTDIKSKKNNLILSFRKSKKNKKIKKPTNTLMVLALYWFWLVNFDPSESQLVQFGHLVVSMTWISRCWSTGYCLHLFRWVFSKLLLQLLHRRALITQFPPSTVLTLHIECWNYPSSSTDEFTILIPLLLISYFFSQDSVNDDGPPVPSHKQVCVVTVC